jgi:hypothetical protein
MPIAQKTFALPTGMHAATKDISEATDEVNQWLNGNPDINVINIETIIIADCYNSLRVWYRHALP